MRSWTKANWAMAWLGTVIGASAAQGQVVERERDTKLTGPRGRTIERSVRTERGPGFVDRQVEIKRPGETLIRDTRIQQPGGYYGPRPGYRPGPAGRPMVVERDVIVERAPFVAPFVAPFLSFSFGSPPPPPPPPPVVYVPEPVYVPEQVYAVPPVVVAAPPVVYTQPPAPVVPAEPPPSPQVADALGRLASFHHQSRRDGCLTLGHLGDPRAVPPLMDRVQHDLDREVRVAAAWALGEIADPRAAVVLERAALYDKRQEVRDAAKSAYGRLPKPVQPTASPRGDAPPAIISQPAPAPALRSASTPLGARPVALDPGPSPAGPGETPPPFPTPEPPVDLPR